MDDENKFSVEKVEKAKSRWLKFGGMANYHFTTDNGPNNFTYNLEDQYFYNVSAIFNRIGFFYGTIYHDPSMVITKDNGFFIKDKPSYHEGGMYLGMSKSIFLKVGYTSFEGVVEEYANSKLKTTLQSFTQSGITAGLTVMLPVLQVEVGYNYGFNSFYAGAGLNIPIKLK